MPNSTRGKSEQMLLFQFSLGAGVSVPRWASSFHAKTSAYLFENLNRGGDRSGIA